MVKFLGPFYLSSGEQEHSINMPNYVGAVRFMVVAGSKQAYGSADKSVKVKSPLMVLPTIPRVLGPAETFKMPVTVFAMEENIQDVEVSIKLNDLLSTKESTQKIHFDKPGEKVVYFNIEVSKNVGAGDIEVFAECGEEKASSKTEIEVRNPNLPITKTDLKVLKTGEEYTYKSVLNGIAGKNTVMLDVSGLPPLDLGGRLQYLIRYPYGCAEQKTSSVFPQLFLDDIMELSQDKKISIERNVKEGIRALKNLQLYNGGFRYWPGMNYANDWVSSYAGHFLLEAKKKGYLVPDYVISKWVNYQIMAVNDWTPIERNRRGIYYHGHYQQAYRLFTLALAGYPQYGAMNRLRNMDNRTLQASWVLAAAYAIVGQDRVATRLIDDLSYEFKSYRSSSTYGSPLRDKAFVLMALNLLDREEEAIKVFNLISKSLSNRGWYSTQTTAFCLVAATQFITDFSTDDSRIVFDYTINNEESKSVNTLSSFKQIETSRDDGEAIEIKLKNNSESDLFLQITNSGRPVTGDQTSEEENLVMDVYYYDENGDALDISKLEQGSIFYAEVSIKNPGILGYYENMALNQVLPSGWEVINNRVGDFGEKEGDEPVYQDVRDDRVYTFFDLKDGQRKSFVIMLSASFPGKFYMPFTYCEDMYDNTIYSRKAGQWVEVIIPEREK